MNRTDDQWERMLSERLAEIAPAQPPAGLTAATKEAVGSTRRRPRWQALLIESPMRTDSRLAVGSPVARAGVVLAATATLLLMLVGASIAGARLLGADAIVVAQDGSGDFVTIAEALQAATDGQRIEVSPGLYRERVVIDKDVELIGRGDASDVMIEAPEGGDTGIAIVIEGSAPRVGSVTVSSMLVTSGASPLIEASEVLGLVDLDDAGRAILRGNRLQAVRVDVSSSATIEANTFSYQEDGPTVAISVDQNAHNTSDGVSVRSNVVAGAYDYAITVSNNYAPRTIISRNDVSDAGVAILLAGFGPTVVEDNQLHDNSTAVRAGIDAVATVQGNVLEDNEVALSLAPSARVSLTDNELCGNGTNADTAGGSEVRLDANDGCEPG